MPVSTCEISHRLRRNSPAPMSSAEETATWATTSVAPGPPCSGRGAGARPLLQLTGEVAGPAQRRKCPHHQPGGHRDHQVEGQHRAVEVHLHRAGAELGGERHQQREARPRPGRAPARPPAMARVTLSDEQVPQHPAPRGAERGADRQLLLPAGDAGQGEVGDVGADDEEEERRGGEEEQQRRPGLGGELLADGERLQAEPLPLRIVRRADPAATGRRCAAARRSPCAGRRPASAGPRTVSPRAVRDLPSVAARR